MAQINTDARVCYVQYHDNVWASHGIGSYRNQFANLYIRDFHRARTLGLYMAQIDTRASVYYVKHADKVWVPHGIRLWCQSIHKIWRCINTILENTSCQACITGATTVARAIATKV